MEGRALAEWEKRAEREYARWLAAPVDEDTARELRRLTSEEILDRFYRDLPFGTGGLRGIMGAGTARMNRYVVRRATAALARYLLGTYGDGARGVVIAYDSRRNSRLFAEEAAGVLTAAGVRAYLFDDVRPTPELSFAVRHLRALAGIVITASHNPPEYNGYKVYGEDGGQITLRFAEALTREMKHIADPFGVPMLPLAEAQARGLVEYVGEAVDEAYYARVLDLLPLTPEGQRSAASVRIVYTPLHGTGGKPVETVLRRKGFSELFLVPEQREPDGNFPTVRVPNPEEEEAFRLALDWANRLEADLVLATDPDADRLGVFVRGSDGILRRLTGNQLGVLLLAYILRRRKEEGTLPPNGAVVKTIVTTELGRKIAEAYGLSVFDVLTGFKFIGEKILEFETTGSHTFVFGFEESYGYLAGSFVRDKDAVQAALLVSQLVAELRAQGRTAWDLLREIEGQYGVHRERLLSYTYPGASGEVVREKKMAAFRRLAPEAVGFLPLVRREDYLERAATDVQTGEKTPLALPRSDVVRWIFADGSWLAVRPSGTEPKLKVYLGVVGADEGEAERKLALLEDFIAEHFSRPEEGTGA
ncbi:phospho-sugar mutase [Brockia lithotrophica]|uniref:Phosphoglucomutase n=1 Tax=Brockia lithotrophica TaxID=933949 RepID=A0A660KTH4_9BACL|nr:phospho-sugar mutase [Brockia lithotrophica]RKQ83881.1 alpha-phosphoglucomutase [Brockia lithotrophica]